MIHERINEGCALASTSPAVEKELLVLRAIPTSNFVHDIFLSAEYTSCQSTVSDDFKAAPLSEQEVLNLTDTQYPDMQKDSGSMSSWPTSVEPQFNPGSEMSVCER